MGIVLVGICFTECLSNIYDRQKSRYSITENTYYNMNWEEYEKKFDEILNADFPTGMYAEESVLIYTKLNEARQGRWLKKAQLLPELVEFLKNLTSKQHWVVITEHWCGDASHIVPIIQLLQATTDMVTVDYQLRDSNSEIEKYLYKGGKAIPILVVRDENGKDLFHWGPRPAPAQELYFSLKGSDEPYEDMKIALQKWYNADRAVSLQKELLEKFKAA